MVKNNMKVAIVQLKAGEDKAKNIANAQKLIKRAIRNKAKFIILPEVFIFRGKATLKRLREDIAESTRGPTITEFKHLAKEHNVCILAGSIYEKVPGKPKVYNASVFINQQGRTKVYRKIKLFDARIKGKKISESDTFYAGAKQAIVDVFGFKVGLAICYDLRFADFFRRYAKRGVDAICVPSAFTYQTGKMHWEILTRARAIETQAFILAPNQTGNDSKGVRCYGHSLVVNPTGKVVVNAGLNPEKILYVEMSKKSIQQARSILPTLNND